MSEFGYILNHWFTIVWLSAAALYVYATVIGDLVIAVRARKKSAAAEYERADPA